MTIDSFVDKSRFQFRFALQFSRAIFISICFASILFYFFTSRELGNNYNQVLLSLFDLNQSIVLAMLFTGGIVLVATSLSVWLIALIKSNKIAGPVYRLENSIEAIGRGDLALTTGFRGDDAVNNLAEELNQTTEILNAQFCNIEKSIHEIKKEFLALENGSSESSNLLLERIRETKNALSYFKTDKCEQYEVNNAI